MIGMQSEIPSAVVQASEDQLLASIFNQCPTIKTSICKMLSEALGEHVEPDVHKLEEALRSNSKAFLQEVLLKGVELTQARLIAKHMEQYPNSRCRKKVPFYWWTTWGKIEFVEQVFTDPEAGFQRFVSPAIGVTNRGMSKAMMRVAADFGLESSFAHAVERIQEHYGFEINTSAIRKATYKTCQKCTDILNKKYDTPCNAIPAKGESVILAEADGSMVRTVADGLARDDKRPLGWSEVGVLLATPIGSTTTHYAATFGDVVELGNRWGHTANDAGRGLNSHIHVVADGAQWIRITAASIFGVEHTFLIDYPHCCGYLHAAAEICAPTEVMAWFGRQKKALLCNESEDILREIAPYKTPNATKETENAADKAWGYIHERRDCLDYMGATDAGLPIGSGQIESAHRHVVQERLKGPGKSWLLGNAELMIQGRVFRANKQWAHLWDSALDKKHQLN